MKPDPERMLSGRPQTTKVPSKMDGEVHASEDFTAFTGGWGQSVASNLTPDPATGLGTRYNEAKFIQTMRTGKKPEGVQLLPPMPTDVEMPRPSEPAPSRSKVALPHDSGFVPSTVEPLDRVTVPDA